MANDLIDEAVLERLPLHEISEVVFYKRDELTTDLICCDISIGERVYFFHEQARGWDRLIAHVRALPGFRSGWFGEVAQPPFAVAEFIAFQRDGTAPTSPA